MGILLRTRLGPLPCGCGRQNFTLSLVKHTVCRDRKTVPKKLHIYEIALSCKWKRKVVDDTCWLSTKKPLHQFKNEQIYYDMWCRRSIQLRKWVLKSEERMVDTYVSLKIYKIWHQNMRKVGFPKIAKLPSVWMGNKGLQDWEFCLSSLSMTWHLEAVP